MSAALLLSIALISLITAYIVYGGFLARRFKVDKSTSTPAVSKADGVDYVPARIPVLMGHHFASIAGAAPIIGPIFAMVFGWIPVFLWIILGSIFLGGAHDFSSLMASVRHGGMTISEVIEKYIGKTEKRLFIGFAWAVLVLVIAVFVNAIVAVFKATPSTATASGLFIAVAIAFGLAVTRLKLPLLLSSVIGVAVLFLCVFIGVEFPISLAGEHADSIWKVLLFTYVFFAAVVPVWLLLQPRDYLCAFLLYGVLGAGAVGIFIANPTVSAPAFSISSNLGFIFPILFVTVACGAISGFHSLVSSGTTAKQLKCETDAQPVAYGSMLIEGFLAVVAMITAATLLSSDYSATLATGGPIAIFSNGIGRFVASIGIPEQIGITFAALAISAFALTTLDTATRLGRFLIQELFKGNEGEKPHPLNNRYSATILTIVAAMILTFSGKQGELWPLFGASNQLLASVALLAVTVWLSRLGTACWFVKLPMFFMFAVTLTALALKILQYGGNEERNIPLLVISILLFAFASVLIVRAFIATRANRKESQSQPVAKSSAPVDS